ncbi:DUF707 domain-containing protein [Methylobacterium brachiatum]|uniref:DUF707 domain-containing protein n=1 Tax=Methylobacterium brachiatum TaxID=269660 RepID=UPI0008E89F2F|nr:DUF707 domain-containing protein [Methylobacterium brachiatum]SFJ06836.1 Protein of unknown function [Methylobacterium brachiatum]
MHLDSYDQENTADTGNESMDLKRKLRDSAKKDSNNRQLTENRLPHPTDAHTRNPSKQAEASLCKYAWVFSSVDGSVISPQLILNEDGEIGGIRNPRVVRWCIENEMVHFKDESNATVVRFVIDRTSTPQKMVLAGIDESGQIKTHYLRETDRYARAPFSQEIQVLEPIANRKKHLVVLSANSKSLHTQWPQDIDPNRRSWDLCLAWYGDETSFSQRPPSEYSVLLRKGNKLQCLHRLCYPGSPIFDYDYVAFPDDDIVTSWRDLNKIFQLCVDFNLILGQPSLSHDSYISHSILRQQPDKIVRFTNFVEIMTPFFSQSALRRCCGTFHFGPSGWGLDYAWPVILGDPRNRIGVIDAVPVHHTRPVGQSYDTEAACRDLQMVCQAYGVTADYLEYGGISRFGRQIL